MTVEERLAAVERALTDGEVEPAVLSDRATVERRLETVENRLDAVENRLAETEAGLDAIRGSRGEERRAIDEVERTAATALSTARRVERRVDADEPPNVGDARCDHDPQRPSLDPKPHNTEQDGSARASEPTPTAPVRWLRRLVDRS